MKRMIAQVMAVVKMMNTLRLILQVEWYTRTHMGTAGGLMFLIQ